MDGPNSSIARDELYTAVGTAATLWPTAAAPQAAFPACYRVVTDAMRALGCADRRALRIHDVARDHSAVWGADILRLDLARRSSRLLVTSLGVSRKFLNDHIVLRHGLHIRDALFACCLQHQKRAS